MSPDMKGFLLIIAALVLVSFYLAGCTTVNVNVEGGVKVKIDVDTPPYCPTSE